MELPKRKHVRLKNYDYSQNGAYFVTICTRNKERILSKIVGQAAPCLPQVKLTEIGCLADKYINNIANVYDCVTVDKYIIMPNHIHMIIDINLPFNGGQGTDRPTLNDIVRSVKVMTTKNAGFSVF